MKNYFLSFVKVNFQSICSFYIQLALSLKLKISGFQNICVACDGFEDANVIFALNEHV